MNVDHYLAFLKHSIFTNSTVNILEAHVLKKIKSANRKFWNSRPLKTRMGIELIPIGSRRRHGKGPISLSSVISSNTFQIHVKITHGFRRDLEMDVRSCALQ